MKKCLLILLLGVAGASAGDSPETAHGLVRAETIYPPPLEEVRYAKTFQYEWWHFDLEGWEKYPPMDVSFEELGRGVLTTKPAP